jgi:murein DD-endopeptidase MepM/ murein hydrolase activator NlpD
MHRSVTADNVDSSSTARPEVIINKKIITHITALTLLFPQWISDDLIYEFERLYLRDPVKTITTNQRTEIPIANPDFIAPITPITISGWVFNDPRLPAHVGIDLGCASGQALLATESGSITRYWNQDCGKYLSINHGNGWISYYCHLSSYTQSLHVNKGDIVGYCGNTGNSTGPHLHFEIRRYNIAIDPLKEIQ